MSKINVDPLVQQALHQAKNGQMDTARQTLAQALNQDPSNSRAWYLFSYLVQPKSKQIYCLQQALKFRPHSPAARKRLSQLSAVQATGKPPQTKTPAPSLRVWPLLASLAFIGLVCLFSAAFLWQTAALAETNPDDYANALASLTPSTRTMTATLPTQTASPTATMLPSPTPTATFTSTPLPSETPTQTSTPTATMTATDTPVPTVTDRAATLMINPPSEAYINNISGFTQRLPLSCEARSASDWAAYFGVGIDELVFQSQLPVSDNPDKGFVGDVMGSWGQIPPNPYGVHARPVADLLRTYGLNATAVYTYSLNGIKQHIAAGQPVIVWVVGAVELGASGVYTDAEGDRSIVAPFEHTVIVIGYSDSNLTFLDGSRIYQRSVSTFLQSWQALGYQAIILEQ